MPAMARRPAPPVRPALSVLLPLRDALPWLARLDRLARAPELSRLRDRGRRRRLERRLAATWLERCRAHEPRLRVVAYGGPRPARRTPDGAHAPRARHSSPATTPTTCRTAIASPTSSPSSPRDPAVDVRRHPHAPLPRRGASAWACERWAAWHNALLDHEAMAREMLDRQPAVPRHRDDAAARHSSAWAAGASAAGRRISTCGFALRESARASPSCRARSTAGGSARTARRAATRATPADADARAQGSRPSRRGVLAGARRADGRRRGHEPRALGGALAALGLDVHTVAATSPAALGALARLDAAARARLRRRPRAGALARGDRGVRDGRAEGLVFVA